MLMSDVSWLISTTIVPNCAAVGFCGSTRMSPAIACVVPTVVTCPGFMPMKSCRNVSLTAYDAFDCGASMR